MPADEPFYKDVDIELIKTKENKINKEMHDHTPTDEGLTLPLFSAEVVCWAPWSFSRFF